MVARILGLPVALVFALNVSSAEAHPRSKRFLEQTAFFKSGGPSENGYEQVAVQLRAVVSVCNTRTVMVEVQLVPNSVRFMSPMGSPYWYAGERLSSPRSIPFPALQYGKDVYGTVMAGGTSLGRFRTLADGSVSADCGGHGDAAGTLPEGIAQTDDAITEWLRGVSVQFDTLSVLKSEAVEAFFAEDARQRALLEQEQKAAADRTRAAELELKRAEAARLQKAEADRVAAAEAAAEEEEAAEAPRRGANIVDPFAEGASEESDAQLLEALEAKAQARREAEDASAARAAAEEQARSDKRRKDEAALAQRKQDAARGRSYSDRMRSHWSSLSDRANAVPVEEIQDELDWLNSNTVVTQRYGASDQRITFTFDDHGAQSYLVSVGWYEISELAPTETGRVHLAWMANGLTKREQYITPRDTVSAASVISRIASAARKKGNSQFTVYSTVPDRDEQYLRQKRASEPVGKDVSEKLLEGAFSANWEATFSAAGDLLGGTGSSAQSLLDARLKIIVRWENIRALAVEFAAPGVTWITLPPTTLLPLDGSSAYSSSPHSLVFFSPSIGIAWRLYEDVAQEASFTRTLHISTALQAGPLLLPAGNDEGRDGIGEAVTKDFFPTPGVLVNASIGAQMFLGKVGLGITVGGIYTQLQPSTEVLRIRSWTGSMVDGRLTMSPVAPLLPYISLKALVYFGDD
ncbi:MAG: hypothetical protein M3Y59_20580 [Myxococcota bacterium]|nr:hypothetical protein [Myxococcota bacterium]